MSWELILQHDTHRDEPLLRRIDALFAQQRATWPALREGEAALRHLQTKALAHDGASVVVQVNPGRRRSTHANVDSASVAARPCFLCPQNMPPEERGVAFENLVILPNPYPILPRHCTVADREHRPQRLAGRVDKLLRLAAAFGPEMAAFYNGPGCGASAPDHFHLQASNAGDVPILGQLPTMNEKHHRTALVSFGRSMLLFTGAHAADVRADIEHTINTLRRMERIEDDEPMFNLLVHFKAGLYIAVFFPRRAHRPACYYATGRNHLAISPAILEMSGVLVTPDPDQFASIAAPAARAIYEEVSLEPTRCKQLIHGGEFHE